MCLSVRAPVRVHLTPFSVCACSYICVPACSCFDNGGRVQECVHALNVCLCVRVLYFNKPGQVYSPLTITHCPRLKNMETHLADNKQQSTQTRSPLHSHLGYHIPISPFGIFPLPSGTGKCSLPFQIYLEGCHPPRRHKQTGCYSSGVTARHVPWDACGGGRSVSGGSQ